MEKLEWLSYGLATWRWKNFKDKFIRFHMIHEHDRQTNTDTAWWHRPRSCIESHGQKFIQHSAPWRPKIQRHSEDRELTNQARSKPDTFDRPVRTARIFVDHYNGTYEGRSINKLQNGAIPLILKIWKIRNIHFAGNLILKIERYFLMMTSLLWRHLFIEHSLSVYYFLHQFSIITHKWYTA